MTGKTKTSVEILRNKCSQEKRLLRTLIVCPLVVMHNWKREIIAHSNIDEKDIEVIDGKTKKDGSRLANPNLKLKIEQAKAPSRIKIINYDNVGNKNIWPIIKNFYPEFLIVDESHKFKSPSAKRTKELHKLSMSNMLKYRFILTGSPILNNALDLWAQFFILNPNILGGNFFSFRSEYFYDANAGMPSNVHFPNWIIKKGASDRLNEVIYKHANRVMKKDVLDLPPINYQVIEVELEKEQSRIYKEMKKDLVAFLENPSSFDLDNDELDSLPEIMKADLAIVKTLRLMQLISGVFSSIEGSVKLLPTNRLKILRDLIEEIASNFDNKVIVWTVFKPTYKAISEICTDLNIGHTFLTGEVKDKQAEVDKFNNDPECRVIIANQGAGGTGVNLTAANYSIYYSRSFNLEHDLQSEARNYRGGQKKNVTRIDLVTPDTIDAAILDALRTKKQRAEDILASNKLEFTAKEILNLV